MLTHLRVAQRIADELADDRTVRAARAYGQLPRREVTVNFDDTPARPARQIGHSGRVVATGQTADAVSHAAAPLL